LAQAQREQSQQELEEVRSEIVRSPERVRLERDIAKEEYRLAAE